MSQHYLLEEKVAENDLAQSWIATEAETSRRCFVKTLSPADSISKEDKLSFLRESYDCQKKLRTHRILRAVARKREGGGIYVEYPYLDNSVWKPLSASLLLDHLDSLLPDICLVMDHIHLMGLIHGDIKLDNFLVDTSGSRPRLILADLDFLGPVNRELNAKIFGTRSFMAPEVEGNEQILTTSDNYSLGVAMRDQIKEAIESDPGSTNGERINDLTERLTRDDPGDRPQVLLDAILDTGLIGSEESRSLNRTLLSMQLLACYITQLKRSSISQGAIRRILVEQNRVHGLLDEFLGDIESAFRKNETSAFRLSLKLLSDAQIERYLDYWHVSLSDDQLREAYLSLHESGLIGKLFPVMRKSDMSEAEATKAREAAASLGTEGHYAKSYLSLKAIESGIHEKSEMAVTGQLYGDLGDASAALGRGEEAAKYYELASASDSLDQSSRIEYLRSAAFQRILLGNEDEARRLLDLGLKAAELTRDTPHKLEFLRLEAWIAGARGRIEESRKVLDNLLKEAEDSGDSLQQIRIYNDLGTLCWRVGDYRNAEEYYKKSIDLASAKDTLQHAASSLSNMSMLCLEILEYDKAIKWAKQSIKFTSLSSDMARLPLTYRNILANHIRLGDYQKAEYWQQRCVSGRYSERHEKYFGNFILDAGSLSVIKGDLMTARLNFKKAVTILGKLPTVIDLGRAHFGLTQVSLYVGDSKGFEQNEDCARNVYTELGDKTSLTHLSLLSALFQMYYSDNDSARDVLAVTLSLSKSHLYYAACEGLFHILIDDETGKLVEDLDEFAPLIERISKSGAPLCKALTSLIEFHVEPDEERMNKLSSLKTAYKHLRSNHQVFLMMLTSQRIASCYLESGKENLAKRFLENALKLAHRLGNSHFEERIGNQIASISRDNAEKRKLVQTILAISSIIKDISSYDETLNALVEYAVDMTGAERGALLLRRRDSEELQMKAYLNCDDESLADIVDFSGNVVRNVVDSEHPLIIDNALDDKRTKSYKSIVAHNILSVICIPVYADDEVLGVLYLDHHTIPALFTEEDVEFISAIANFLSHIATISREFRKFVVSTNEYLGDLKSSGSHQELITVNSTMLAMLDELPRIARSDAAVLITGESGTGKEILCELIHAKSKRSEQQLVKLNCAAIPSTEIESELFGVAKNAFTGVAAREGKFAAADGGTLFLDEIGDLPFEIQGRVLKVLEYQEFERRGSIKTIYTDARFIYATNKNLREMVEKGLFRKDLFYRIDRITIEIPPLRERLDDIPPLLEHFTGIFCRDRKSRPSFSPDAIAALAHHEWPGNVRELRNLVESFCILNPGKLIGIDDLPKSILESIRGSKSGKKMPESLRKELIKKYLKRFNGNKSKVAEKLGIPLTTLRRLIAKYGLDDSPSN